MDQSKYDEVLSDYRLAVHTALKLSQHLEGRSVETGPMQYAEACFKTILCFGSTVLQSVPGGAREFEQPVWNLPSACTAARAIIEAYRALSYIALHKIPDEERELRMQVMQLHDLDRRISVAKRLGKFGTSLPSLSQEADARRTALFSHALATKLTAPQCKEIRSGDSPAFLLTATELDTASGIDTGMRMVAQIFLSQFAHTFPMGMHSMYHFEPDTPEARRYMATAMQYSIGYVLRATDDVGALFSLTVTYEAGAAERLYRHVALVNLGLNAVPQEETKLTDAL